MSTPRPGGPVLAVLGVVVALALTVVAAGVAAPWTLEDRPLWRLLDGDLAPVDLPTPDLDRTDPGTPLPEREPRTLRLDWLRAVAWGLAVAAAGLLAWWFWWRYRQSGLALPERDAGHAGPALDATDALELPVVEQGVVTARAVLDAAADPADAIIAAWLALEDAAERSGVRRAPSQTPTELTLAVLDRTRADATAARGFLRLYHRARFSGRPATAGDVAAARRHLDALAASWEALRVGGGGQR